MTYSTTMNMGRREIAKRNQNLISWQEHRQSLGPISNAIIIIALTVLLGVVYLTQVTKTNEIGYDLQELRDKHTQLKIEGDDLKLQAAKLQAVERIQSSEIAKAMPQASPTIYISAN